MTDLKIFLPDLSSTKDCPASERLARLGPKLIEGVCAGKPPVPDDQLMFDKESIRQAQDQLLKMFRYICYKERVTPEDYRRGIYKYELEGGKTMSQAQTTISNSKKAIFGAALTMMQFERNMNYLGKDIVNMSFDLKDPETGEVTRYNSSDISQIELDAELAHELKKLKESE